MKIGNIDCKRLSMQCSPPRPAGNLEHVYLYLSWVGGADEENVPAAATSNEKRDLPIGFPSFYQKRQNLGPAQLRVPHHRPRSSPAPESSSSTLLKTPTVQTCEAVPEASPSSSSNGSAARIPQSDSQPSLRPHTLVRSSSDRPTTTGQNDSASNSQLSIPVSASTPAGRRASWLSSLSYKFSSSSLQPSSNTASPTTSKTQSDKVTQNAVNAPTNSEDAGKHGGNTSPPPSATKSSHPSFFQSALRRLSSSSTQLSGNVAKPLGTGGRVERRVMNIDRNRERCRIQELEAGKLRRVSFCVDVEIAGAPRYPDEGYVGKKSHERDKEKKIKEKGEGEALKHPQKVENDGDGEGGEAESAAKANKEGSGPKDPGSKDSKKGEEIEANAEEKKPSSKKKEKKKRSEGERKERKVRKRKQAEANGTVPMEHTVETNQPPAGDMSSCSTPGNLTPKPQDRPTTDPLRIYRRCCQLRETPTLKKIVEQLSSPAYAETGVVLSLDLSENLLQFADVVTFSDFLALVPVKKLNLENSGLGDEAVRVILAGLLAVRGSAEEEHPLDPPQLAVCIAENGSTGQSKNETPRKHAFGRGHGVVEKLSLKNNSKIGRDGWRYISCFIHLSRSVKAIDLSMIPFPQEASTHRSPGPPTRQTTSGGTTAVEIACIFSKAIAERLGGAQLEELAMAECGLSPGQIGKIVDGVIRSGVRRLGLASNGMNEEGLEHVARYVREASCEGLDLGGNDLGSLISTLTGAMHDKCPLCALSLADCNLTPSSLSRLFPALVSLPNFRFIDLSHNRTLFQAQPDALPLIRKYLPQLRMLKRIHLVDVELTPEHAISLSEILPEVPNLAHLNILENSQLSALTSTGDETSQEEASALYASLMSAVKVSNTIICIDVDVPGDNSSEVVKALAKQVIAYCLRNMERITELGSTAAATMEPHEEKKVAIPDVLLHLVGHAEDGGEDQSDDQSVHENDYVVGGTGIVKALGVCLGNMSRDSRQYPSEPSADVSDIETQRVELAELGYRGKAKDMSKNLLDSARKIRSRLQPALAREDKMHDYMNYRRLLFLDQTLAGMIQRFEDEYPECRLSNEPSTSYLSPYPTSEPGSSPTLRKEPSTTETEDEDAGPLLVRHNSDVSLASRALSNEEGRMHRFGQRIRREVFRPETLDHHHGTTGEEEEAQPVKALRCQIESMKSEEIIDKVETLGAEAVIRELSTDVERLHSLAKQDPEAFEQFRAAQLMAEHNNLATTSFPDSNHAVEGSPEGTAPGTNTNARATGV
ncbi:hypothetical protein GP486_000079 [Trichoglossum hirsutum]|uniref:Cell wall biogenesis protein Mhp1 n=1 Tax=Trichoglossum hirsutum TaxID=265104 RepID=A0A9P8RUA8_9PEZI|nr:hypothetical protein GP486_000079 [Trichoglossum hirsutum]